MRGSLLIVRRETTRNGGGKLIALQRSHDNLQRMMAERGLHGNKEGLVSSNAIRRNRSNE
jgi:hypothetical protein